MGDFWEFIIWSSLDNSKDNSYCVVIPRHDSRDNYFIFKPNLPHFFHINYFHLIITISFIFSTHQHGHELIN